MLDSSQCEIIAYLGDGSVVHRECAREEFSGETLANVDSGLFVADEDASELQPLIRYDVDTWASEDAGEQYDIRPSEDRERVVLVHSDDGAIIGTYDSEGEAETALWELPCGPSCDRCGGYILEKGI